MKVILGFSISILALFSTAYATNPQDYNINDTSNNQKYSTNDDSGLDILYRNAIAEGGSLLVYEGGDRRNGQATTNTAFNARFPGMNATLIVDLSKYHDAEIDKQLASGKLDVDVAHLQTVHDFYRWKKEDALMQFKPPHWDSVYPEIKDTDGYFTATAIFTFAPNALRSTYEAGEGPIEDEDFLNAKFKNKIVLTYPHDDDAVLYQFYKLAQKHGQGYIEKLLSQNIKWVRGTGTPRNIISNGTIPDAVTFTSSNALVPTRSARVITKIPLISNFLTWGQTAAIFKKAPHPAAAKLYVAWRLSTQAQKGSFTTWSTRKDIDPPIGYKRLEEYTNTSRKDFVDFMLNRTLVEKLKSDYEKLIGPVKGDTPLNDPAQ
ncbi:hypothetical protein BB561_001161 [Smittium simulii]|uniref:Uncharacterized protein n=1 Tax=Smittium simulii TaxID=133385 RepID=A0A2T9YVS5_9FUNG|nr:hypothetical protein BB561_001161 [Smittium simulii]